MKYVILGLALLASTSPVIAASYTQASFTGQLGSSPNIKDPFKTSFTGGQTFSGSFVFQDDLVPAGPGFTNIFFDNFTDAASISAADAFTINFGSHNWTKADNLDSELLAGIQYSGGAFRGFVFHTNFDFEGQTYQFGIEGGTISVMQVVNGFVTGNSLINGTINAPYTDATAFTPGDGTPPVPEPAIWAMMLGGFGLVGAAMRRRTMTVSFA